MKRLGGGRGALLAALLLAGIPAQAQSSLDALDKDLDQIQQEHHEAVTKNLDSFLGTLETASDSAEDAVKLYKEAGGMMPPATRVQSQYQDETPTEKAARLALDQAMLAQVSGALQLHCGMMRLAALFVTAPTTSTLPGDWISWLKSAAQIYPQVAAGFVDTRPKPPAPEQRRRRDANPTKIARLGDDPSTGNSDSDDDDTDADQQPTKIDVAKTIRQMSMHESIIGTYLGFNQWGDSEQGKWKVSDIPELYRKDVLEPLRTPITAAAIPAWDSYIAMKNADEPDQQKWAEEDYPALEFERDYDDFESGPSSEKIEPLVALIKANPHNAHLDDWISRVHTLVKTLRAQQAPGAPAAPSNALPPIQPDAPATTNSVPGT